jgi:hypothetical protein
MNYIKLFSLSFYVLFFWLGVAYFTTAQSVLKEGTWLKIPIRQSGIYKITPAFLRQVGINPSIFNPKNLHIYGNGGGMLPQNNSTPRAIDLVENAIFVAGENDNSFDENDYILFYAQEANQWEYNNANQTFIHQKNLYDDFNYYFLTYNDTQGLRINTQASNVNTNHITSFDDYFFYENDNVNVLKSGREWYGEEFGFVSGKSEYNFSFNLTGLLPNSIFKFSAASMGRDVNVSFMQWSINNQTLFTQTIPLQPLGTWSLKGTDAINNYSGNSNFFGNNENINIKARYIQNSNTGIAYINYFRVQYQRKLQLYGAQTTFQSIQSLNNTQSNFIIENVNNETQVWEITNPLIPKAQNFVLNTNILNFGTNTQNILKQFVVFNPSQIGTPERAFIINNQNLSGENVPNMLIVAHENVWAEAQRLAEFRRNNDNLSVLVVSPSQIYNEFSSGRQDISAIRDFARELYQKNSTNFKYLLLFGACSFDYKNRISNNTNLVPIYQSYESLNPIFSFSSDDYFGILGENEGQWQEDPSGDATMEIGVGRIPARSLAEAKIIVDKIIRYNNQIQNLGEWRQEIAFVADDGDANTHQNDAEALANYVDTNYPQYKINKLYLDSFEQISTPNGEICPDIVKALNQVMNKGALIVNYSGHGGEVGWGEEAILRTAQIDAWRNRNIMPLIVTATCEFGRYDNPFVFSGAEHAFFNEIGGAIALLTTTRPVFSSTNFLLNRAFYQNVFEPINNEMPRLGDVMKKTKNGSLVGAINRNFALLGDPSLRLAYPHRKAVITKVNNQGISMNSDTLKALEKVKLEGQILLPNGNTDNNFKGNLKIEVFDKPNFHRTKGTGGTLPMNYQVRNSVLFRGTASVNNGNFSVEFVVPKDINYAFDKGRIVMYAQDNTQIIDAGGAETRLLVGGSIPNANIDNTPPTLSLYLNDENFKNGQEVNPDAWLLAKIFDENGINIAKNGIGHELKAVLDNQTTFILNDFYTANTDDYKNGNIAYLLNQLPTGNHHLRLEVWDTSNNPASASIEFVVAPSPQVAIEELFNYPNPVFDYTQFTFSHNKQGKDLFYEIDIFDMSGKLRQTLTGKTLGTEKQKVVLEWNGVDNKGSRLGAGTYIYQLKITSPEDKTSGKASKKLVIIN